MAYDISSLHANTFTVGPQTLLTGSDSNKGIIIKGNSATQSANLIEAQDSTGTALLIFSSSGLLGLSSGAPSSHLYSIGLTQPTSVGTTPGTDATAEISMTGGTGGNTSIITTGTGGAGSGISLTTGVGGQANLAATASTGGNGGAFTANGGVGGAAAVDGSGNNTGGVGGAFTFTGGTGGAATGATSGTNTGGNGGGVTISGGRGGSASAGGTNTPGNGGTVTINGGFAATIAGSAGGAATMQGRAGSSTGSGGAGGNVTVLAGAAGGDNTVNRAGGTASLTAGASKGSSTGGAITITGGTGGVGTGTAGANGGNITITAGTGGAGSATGGNGGALTLKGGVAAASAGSQGGTLSISGGNGTSTGTGGAGGGLTLTAGDAGGDNTVNRAGGAFNLTSGNSAGSSAGANVLITAGTGGPGTATTGAAGGTVQITGGVGGTGSVTNGAGGTITLRTSLTNGAAVTRVTVAAIGTTTFTPDSTATSSILVNTGGDSVIGALIKGNSATQSSDLLQIQTSAATVLGSFAPTGIVTLNVRDAVTNAVTAGLILDHFSSGTPAADFGDGIQFKLQSSTTASQSAGSIQATWATATHASRKSRLIFNVNDTSTREGLRIETDGTLAQVGVGGATYPSSRFYVSGGNSAYIPVIIQGAASQSVDHLQVQDASSNTILSVSSIGTSTLYPFDTATTTVTDALILDHGTGNTPSAGFGTGITIKASSDAAISRTLGTIVSNWQTVTDASRKARIVFNVYDTAARECIRLEASGSASMFGVLGASAVVRQTSGANVTNNVTSGGTDDTIANFTDLVIYANDAAAIRNNIYQLARKIKQVNDALRLFGFLT